MEIEVDHVEAKAINAAIEPELARFENLRLNLLIVEVEIWLAGEKVMQIVLTPGGVPLPGRAAENG
jgi:hypothetical protein